MQSNIFVVLSFTSETNFWLVNELQKKGNQVSVLVNKYAQSEDFFSKRFKDVVRKRLAFFSLGWLAHKQCRNCEKVIFWNWESVFLFVIRDYLAIRACKAKILALHLILLDTTLLKRLFWLTMFSIVKWHPNLKFAVNSAYEINLYSKKYKIPQSKLAILPDSYEYKDLPDRGLLDSVISTPKTVFCGGASRDWHTYFEVACRLPDYHFIAIAMRKQFHVDMTIPNNVELWFDTTTEFFYCKLYQASLICLPLLRKEACGLIVATKAAKLKKPLVVTDTPNMRNYIRHNENGVLVSMKNVDEIVAAIRAIEKESFRNKLINNMAVDIEEHSPKNYAANILKL